jgi:hypothetical protein
MPQKKKLKIIKIPLGYKPSYKPVQFPPYPQLYLDLLENKDKVKPDLRDVYYEPKEHVDGMPMQIDSSDLNKAGSDVRKEVEVFDKERLYVNTLQFNDNHSSTSSGGAQPPQVSHATQVSHQQGDDNNMFDFSDSATAATAANAANAAVAVGTKSRLDNILHSEPKPSSSSSGYKVPSFPPRKSHSFDSDDEDPENMFSLGEKRREPEREKYREPERPRYREPERERPRERYRDEPQDEVEKYFEESEDDDVLGQFLSKSSKPESKSVYKQQSHKQSSSHDQDFQQPNTQPSAAPQAAAPQPQQQQQQQPQQQSSNYPPSLQSIAAGEGMKQGVMNMQMKSISEAEEAQQKRELLLKFKTLKKYYKEAVIPEYTEYANLDIMKADYAMLVKQLHLDSRIENYKRILMVGFGVVEFLIQRVLKFEEISGFTAQQMISMNDYERILLEIGEKHKVEPGEGLGPELKLIGLVFFNAAVFVGMKMLMKGGGNTILDSIGGIAAPQGQAPRPQAPPPMGGSGAVGQVSSGQAVGSTTSQPVGQQAPKRRMKGPEISLDDF